MAIDANHPHVLAAGPNDNIDMEACNAGSDNTCPFTDGVGASGVSFSFDSGTTWVQPTYTGWSACNCTGAVGDSDPPCQAQVGPIGTLPGYMSANGRIDPGQAVRSSSPRGRSAHRFAPSRRNTSTLASARITRPSATGSAPVAAASSSLVRGPPANASATFSLATTWTACEIQ